MGLLVIPAGLIVWGFLILICALILGAPGWVYVAAGRAIVSGVIVGLVIVVLASRRGGPHDPA